MANEARTQEGCTKKDIAPSGSIQTYKGHGVWVPNGQSAAEVMEGAWALEREFDVAPFVSRIMASAVLSAVARLKERTSDSPQAGREAASSSPAE